MSILISFTDRGACIYDENGELCIKGLTQHKVLRKCDGFDGKECENNDVKWILFCNLVRDRKEGNEKDRCVKCAKLKSNETCIKKYGDCFNREKTKQTIWKKYGVKNISQIPEIKDKKKETCLSNFGVEYPLQSKEIREKTKQTTIERYGVEYPIQSDVIKEKTKQTNMEKYGVEHVLQSKEIKEKAKQTCKKKYGVEYPIQLEEMKEKAKQTNIKRYGVENYTQTDEYKEKFGSGKNHSNWNPNRHDMEEFCYFRKDVEALSNQIYKKHYHEINPSNFPRNKDYHLDHIISIRDCWDAGIRDIYIPSHPQNLQMLTQHENQVKSSDSHMPLKNLLEYCQNDGIDISLSGVS